MLTDSLKHASSGNLGSANRSWYAIYTRPQHEKVIAQALTNKGIETFLPLYLSRREWKDRRKDLLLPLFPSYLFVTDWDRCKMEVLRTPGVYQVIEFCGRAAQIPADEIEAVRIVVSSCLRVGPHPFLQCGDMVNVIRGPLAGLRGLLIRKKNACRIIVSVELLSKSISVELDGDDVERLSDWKSRTRETSGPMTKTTSVG